MTQHKWSHYPFLYTRLTSGPTEKATVSFIDHVFPNCPQKEGERRQELERTHDLRLAMRMAEGGAQPQGASRPFQTILRSPRSPGQVVEEQQGYVSPQRERRSPARPAALHVLPLSKRFWQRQADKEALTLPECDSTLVNYYSFPPVSLCISHGGRIIN